MKAITLQNGPSHRYLQGLDVNRASDLSRSMATPFMVLRTKQITANLERLRRALPRAETFYAVKANNHPSLITTLIDNNCSFDISSAQELRLVLECGASVQNTIHTNPIKSIPEFEKAIALGTRIFVADNIDELEKFARYNKKTEVLVRFKTASCGSTINLSYKFGAEIENIPMMLDRIKKLGLSFKGFCFHVGSQCVEAGDYVSAISEAANLITLASRKGLQTRILDIGGGFPIEYITDVPSIESMGKIISDALDKQIDPSIRIICEPGRFLCGDAVTLFSSVIGKTVRGGRKWYYIDDGLYGSFSGRLYDQCTYQILTNRNTKWEKAVLAGPTCDSFDVIYKDCLMPPLDVGDVLIFPAMGAYCRVSATGFNGLNQAKVIAVDW